MARITWQNVGQPDFSTALRGYQSFSDTLNNALGAADRGITRFDNNVTERVNKAFMADVLATKNPDEAQALMQGLRGRDDFNRISMQSMDALDKRPDQLTQRDMRDFSFSNLKRDDARREDTREKMDAAAPMIRAAIAAGDSGDREAYNTAMQGLMASDIPVEQLSKIISDAAGLRAGEQRYRIGEQAYEQGGIRFDREGQTYEMSLQDREDNRAASTLAREAALASNGNSRLYELIINGADVSDNIKNIAMGGGGSGGGGSFGGTGGAIRPATGASSGGFTYNADRQDVASTFSAGGMPDVMVAAALGNFEVEGGYGGALGDKGTDRGRSDGGSASGIAQWRKERRDSFRKRYGKEPHEATKKQQAEFAMWEITTPEGRAASGINKKDADKLMNFRGSPEDAAELFMNIFERPNKDPNKNHLARRKAAAKSAYRTVFDPTASNESTARIAAAAKDTNAHRAGTDSSSWDSRLLAAGNTNTSVNEVAKRVTKKGGEFAGISERRLGIRLEEIISKTGAKPEQAALILQDSVYPATDLQSAWNPFPSQQLRIDDAKLKDNIQKFNSGTYLDGPKRARERAEQNQQINDLQTEKVALTGELEEFEQSLMHNLTQSTRMSIETEVARLRNEIAKRDAAIKNIAGSVALPASNRPSPLGGAVSDVMDAAQNIRSAAQKVAPRDLTPFTAPQGGPNKATDLMSRFLGNSGSKNQIPYRIR